MPSVRLPRFLCLLLVLAFAVAPATAQKESQQEDPLKRELSEKEKQKRAKALRKEISKVYQDWKNSDVRWIITEEELSAFNNLSNDEERDQFIEQFWLRRDPTPDTLENEYKEEHYRRIAYANERFAAGKPGWKTDRGRIYIMFGPPDSIDSHPSGGHYQRPIEEGGGSTSTFPFEVWRYRYLDNIGQEVEIEFVDTCMCGDYHMTMDRSEKDALLHVPGAGLTLYEQMGLASKTERFTGAGLERLGEGPGSQRHTLQSKQFDRLDLYAKLSRPPAVKFKDLEEVVRTKVRYNLMPFDVRTDLIRITDDTSLVPVTIQVQNKDITYVDKEGTKLGVVNIFGRVTTMTGRVAQTFEDTVSIQVPSELLPKTVENASVYWKALPLRRGRYRVDIVVKDVNGDRLGTWQRGLHIPDMSEDRGLVASSLILADLMEKVPSRSVGAGNFVIGSTKVRPRVQSADGSPAKFKRNQELNLWMQVYNLATDANSNRSSAAVTYEIINAQTNKSVVTATESTADMPNPGGQITLEKSVPLSTLEPGTYQVKVTVNDQIANQTISPTAKFVVE